MWRCIMLAAVLALAIGNWIARKREDSISFCFNLLLSDMSDWWCSCLTASVSVSSLQSLNEVLASGSKDAGKAAVEKQVRRGGNTGASETSPKEHPDTPPFAPSPSPCPVATGARGERPAAEGEGCGDPGEAGGPRWRAGQRRRRRKRRRREGLERGRPAAAHQSCQLVSRRNQRQVGAGREALRCPQADR